MTASYTGHGHHIPGTPVKTPPLQRKICGGPDYCLACEEDLIRVFDRRLMLFSNPAGVHPEKVNSLMSTETPEVVTPAAAQQETLFDKVKSAITELGHDAEHAETIVLAIMKKGVGFRKTADSVAKDADEATALSKDVPELATAEPVLEGVDKVVDEADKAFDTAADDAVKVDPALGVTNT